MGTEKELRILASHLRTLPYTSVQVRPVRQVRQVRPVRPVRQVRQVRVCGWSTEGAKHPILGRLSFAALTCRQWQTSEAQLSHRSRKGAEGLRIKAEFFRAGGEGADETSVTEQTAMERFRIDRKTTRLPRKDFFEKKNLQSAFAGVYYRFRKRSKRNQSP